MSGSDTGSSDTIRWVWLPWFYRWGNYNSEKSRIPSNVTQLVGCMVGFYLTTNDILLTTTSQGQTANVKLLNPNVLMITVATHIWTAHRAGKHRLHMHSVSRLLGPLHSLPALLGWKSPAQELGGHATWGWWHHWRGAWKNVAFSHPKFLPAAPLNNLEHILTPLKPAETAHNLFWIQLGVPILSQKTRPGKMQWLSFHPATLLNRPNLQGSVASIMFPDSRTEKQKAAPIPGWGKIGCQYWLWAGRLWAPIISYPPASGLSSTSFKSERDWERESTQKSWIQVTACSRHKHIQSCFLSIPRNRL